MVYIYSWVITFVTKSQMQSLMQTIDRRLGVRCMVGLPYNLPSNLCSFTMFSSQNQYPARIKHVHYYNVGNVMELVMGLVRMLLSEKIRRRVRVGNERHFD